MPIKKTRILILAVVALSAGRARAEAFVLKHLETIYQDEQQGPLRGPEGVACSDTGVVVADTGNARLLSFVYRDGRISGGTAMKVAQITNPVRVQLDAQGNMLVLDRKSKQIARLDPKGAFTGFVELRGAKGAVPIKAASFALDASNRLYVLDVASEAILVADASGDIGTQIPLPRKGLFVDVAVDSSGTIYVLDAVGAVVWSVAKGGSEFKALTGSMKDSVSFPASITAAKGRLLVVDQHGAGVIALAQDGSYAGRQLTMGWSDGALYYPTQICLNDRGDAFIADRANNRVQIFSTMSGPSSSGGGK